MNKTTSRVLGSIIIAIGLLCINKTFQTVFLGISLGLLMIAAAVVIFALLSPSFIELLVNNPKNQPVRPDRIYFFTFIEPGQVKIIIRGKRFIRAIMNDPERVFLKQSGDPRNADYWWIVPAGPTQVSEPIEPLDKKNPLSWWAHYVYKSTGAVFTGIWPFQGLRIDKIKRLTPKIENGKVVLDARGVTVFEEVEDWTDHLRVKNYLWYFNAPTTDTKDYLKIGFQGNMLARCINPYLNTYNQDRWDMVLSSKTNTLITAYGQMNTYSELSQATPENQFDMGNYLKKNLNEMLSPAELGALEKRGTGIEIMQVDITDRDPKLSAAENASLTEPWKADRAKKAKITASEATRQERINISEGEAKSIENISIAEATAIVNRITAIKSDGEIGKMLVEYDAWKAAANAGGATFFFGDNRGGNKDLDPIVFAKLEEIRKELTKKADKAEKAKPESEKAEAEIEVAEPERDVKSHNEKSRRGNR